MKITVSLAEAKSIIASSINRDLPSSVPSVSDEGISIVGLAGEPAVLSPEEGGVLTGDKRVLSRDDVARHVEALIRAAQPNKSNGFHDKIGMIKAVRFLTGLGLKDSKDLVENSLIPF